MPSRYSGNDKGEESRTPTASSLALRASVPGGVPSQTQDADGTAPPIPTDSATENRFDRRRLRTRRRSSVLAVADVRLEHRANADGVRHVDGKRCADANRRPPRAPSPPRRSRPPGAVRHSPISHYADSSGAQTRTTAIPAVPQVPVGNRGAFVPVWILFGSYP